MFQKRILFSAILCTSLATVNLTAMKREREESAIVLANQNPAKRVRFNIPTQEEINAFFNDIEADNTSAIEKSLENVFDLNKMIHPQHGAAIIHAVQMRKPESVKTLIKCGATPNIHSKKTLITPLHIVETPEIAQILLQAGARPDARTRKQKRTPLMYAAEKGLVLVVKQLLAHGADGLLQDIHGDDAYDYGTQNHVPNKEALHNILYDEETIRDTAAKTLAESFDKEYKAPTNLWISTMNRQIKGSQK